jgi:hypothetical protein
VGRELYLVADDSCCCCCRGPLFILTVALVDFVLLLGLSVGAVCWGCWLGLLGLFVGAVLWDFWHFLQLNSQGL